MKNIMGIPDPEKSDLGGLHYLYKIAFFLFFYLSFYLKLVKLQIIKLDFSQNWYQLT